MSEPNYTVWVKTGTQALGGTDSNVFVMLFGTTGNTDWIHLPAEDAFAFEEGAVDKFVLLAPEVGDLTRVCVAHDASADSGWYVEDVRVRRHADEREWTFTFQAWVGDEEAGRRSVCANG